MFWRDHLYKYTRIYDSLSPLMRFCVDLKIQGRSPEHISKITKKPIQTIYKTIRRAKIRYEKAQICEIRTQVYIRGLECAPNPEETEADI